MWPLLYPDSRSDFIHDPIGVDRNEYQRLNRLARRISREQTWCESSRIRLGASLRQICLDPAWLRWHDATIPRLARQMHDSRGFASMPILADALEEAGCTSAD